VRHELPEIPGFSFRQDLLKPATFKNRFFSGSVFFAGFTAGIPTRQIPARWDFNPSAPVSAHGHHLLSEHYGRGAARLDKIEEETHAPAL